MTDTIAGRQPAHDFRMPSFVDAKSLREAAIKGKEPRTAAALEALAMIVEGAPPEEAARTAGTRTGTIQIVLARIAADGSIAAAFKSSRSDREHGLRSGEIDTDGLERAARLFTDARMAERVRWIAAFHRGTPASLISDAAVVPETEVLSWIEAYRDRGLAAFPDEGGVVRSIPGPPEPIETPRRRRPAARPEPESEEVVAAREAAAREAAAREERRRAKKDRTLAAMPRIEPDPAEIRRRMTGRRSEEELAFLISTAMHDEQRRRLIALQKAACSGDVAAVGAEFGYLEKTMYFYGLVLAQQGPTGLLPNRSPLRPYVATPGRAELAAIEAVASSNHASSETMTAVLDLMDGAYPPEVARDLGVAMAELADEVGRAADTAFLALEDLSPGRDVGLELVDAGYLSGDFAALVSPSNSPDERLRAKALRRIVRGERLDQVAADLEIGPGEVEEWVDAVLAAGTDALLDEWQLERAAPAA